MQPHSLKSPALLVNAVQEGIKLLTWREDSFAYADSFDDAAKRYRSPVCGWLISFQSAIPEGLLVKADVALQQLHAEASPQHPGASSVPATPAATTTGPGAGPSTSSFAEPTFEPAAPRLHRFQGSVLLDSTRVGRDAGRVADEVISHLSGIVGAKVKVTLEIQAELPDGAPADVVRIVTQNSRDLKFDSQGFDES